MTWRHIQGWSDDIIPFYEMLAERIPSGGVFVEVGVLLGRSFACMGQLRPDLQVWAVDVWEDGHWGKHEDIVRGLGGLWPAFLTLMRNNAPEVLERAHIVRARSTDVSLRFLADAVFIDAGHDYRSVCDDIAHYLPIVKPGGIIAGHDYQPNYPGVIAAVNEKLGKPTMGPSPGSSVWWFQR